MIRRVAALWAVFLFCAITPAIAADQDRCAEHLPYGSPQVAGEANLTFVCHAGYAAMHDDDKLIPRWVAYRLTGPHTLGCNARSNKFHADEQLPKDRRATPADYTRSGYDRGHQAPAADFAWSKAQSLDSFSMVNMAPQVGALNRAQWERLEEHVRAWALARGEIEVYVGPVVGKRHATIGANFVAVPAGFWKVVVDVKRDDVIAFITPNKATPKGPLDPWLTTVADVEESAGVTLPLPETAARDAVAKLWPADLAGWKKKRKAACKR